MLACIGGPLEPALIQSLVDAVMEFLPPNIYRPALVESTTYLASCEVTADELRSYAWRIAGNLPRLLDNKAVIPWMRQLEQEWMPLQVVDYKLVRNRRNEVCAEYTFRVLSGSACPMLVKKILNRKTCAGFAKDLGFTPRSRRRKSSVYFLDFADLFGLRMFGLFDPELSVTQPKFWHMACPASLRKYNKELLKKRARVGFTCPNGYLHACSKCHVGTDRCEAATHPRTYQLKLCSGCKHEAWFDSKRSTDLCVDCFTKNQLRPEDR